MKLCLAGVDMLSIVQKYARNNIRVNIRNTVQFIRVIVQSKQLDPLRADFQVNRLQITDYKSILSR